MPAHAAAGQRYDRLLMSLGRVEAAHARGTRAGEERYARRPIRSQAHRRTIGNFYYFLRTIPASLNDSSPGVLGALALG
jgi:hypothetical protein